MVYEGFNSVSLPLVRALGFNRALDFQRSRGSPTFHQWILDFGFWLCRLSFIFAPCPLRGSEHFFPQQERHHLVVTGSILLFSFSVPPPPPQSEAFFCVLCYTTELVIVQAVPIGQT